MSPRKKSRHNPKPDAPEHPPDSPGPSTTPASSGPDTSTAPESAPASHPVSESESPLTASTTSAGSEGQTLQKKASRKWLGGSWRSKASATVTTAKESIGISVSGGAASELPKEDSSKQRDQSPAKFLTKRKSSKGDTIPASMTKLNVSSDGSINTIEEPKPQEAPQEVPQEPTPPPPAVDEPPLPPDPPKIDESQVAGTWGWRSWWSRPDGYPEPAKGKDQVAAAEEAQRTPLPASTPVEEPAISKQLGDNPVQEPSRSQDVEMKDAPVELTQGTQDVDMKDAPKINDPAARTSWFWSWSSRQNVPSNPPVPDTTSVPEAVPEIDVSTEDPMPSQEPPIAENPAEPPSEIAATEAAGKEQPKASAWAFWSKAQPKTETQADGGVAHKQVGEVAVANTPSQSQPEPAQFNEEEQPKADDPKSPGDLKPLEDPVQEEAPPKRSFQSLRGRLKSKPARKDIAIDASITSKTTTPAKALPEPSPAHLETAPAAQPVPEITIKTKDESQNFILPEFQATYQLVQQPSFWQQIRHYFLGGEPAMPHLHINPAPPRIKKAVAIGVHGFFPAPIFQKVIGQPRGTSIRFANAATTAIRDWCKDRGYEPEIEQIALEGEGFIADRVKSLWKLLLNWIEHIKSADFIFVACHSQGVPVAVMLVAKLIQFGCVNATRIGICAMAGVNMGPFIEYKTKYFGPTAAELFEFSNPNSLVSQMHLAALDEVLRFGVRVCYVGSLDDQLVPLDSAVFSTLSHPYIYRAVFVDGRIHTPDFLAHLVGFALKLRNLGLPDHGLVRELSPALAGTIYGGEGHSRVYEDPHVYTLALQHALETTSLATPASQARANASAAASFAGINIPVPGAKYDGRDVYKLHVKEYKVAGGGEQNPYFLPWAMRGLLEEEFVKRELGREVEELLDLFEKWKPEKKQLKDVKFRLEGVRSKL